MSVTPEERAVLDKLGEAFNLYEKLPIEHRADLGDFIHGIHACQNIVLARAGLRLMRAPS